MGTRSETIDLTDSFIHPDLPAALEESLIEDESVIEVHESVIEVHESVIEVNESVIVVNESVIEVNDSVYEVPPPLSPPRRSRSTHRQTNHAHYPIGALCRNTRSPNNFPEKEASNSVQDDEDVRDSSTLENYIGTCTICLEKFKSQPKVSTFCGHIFCEICLKLSLREEKKCPTCRKSMRGTNAYHRIYM